MNTSRKMGLYFFCPFLYFNPGLLANPKVKILTISAIGLFNKLVKKIKQK